MELDVQPFKNFMPGNHLVLGGAGVGKTRLIWSLLQSKEFSGENNVNIVLTDHPNPLWYGPNIIPIHHISPYDNNLEWITNPQNPGIYYASCDYLPRMHTFLECLANYCRNTDQIEFPIRVFLDFPNKVWLKDYIMKQIDRLLYITDSCNSEAPELELWMTLTIGKDVPKPDIKGFNRGHNVLLSPLSPSLLESASQILKTSLSMENFDSQTLKKDGFYYLPGTEQKIYFKIA